MVFIVFSNNKYQFLLFSIRFYLHTAFLCILNRKKLDENVTHTHHFFLLERNQKVWNCHTWTQRRSKEWITWDHVIRTHSVSWYLFTHHSTQPNYRKENWRGEHRFAEMISSPLVSYSMRMQQATCCWICKFLFYISITITKCNHVNPKRFHLEWFVSFLCLTDGSIYWCFKWFLYYSFLVSFLHFNGFYLHKWTSIKSKW